MSRRNSNAAGGGVSLFPFLSILACLIGILTLMIKLISDLKATETAGRGEVELALAKQHASIQRQIKDAGIQLENARAELNEKGKAQAMFQDLDDRRIILRKELSEREAANSKESNDQLQRRVEILIDQIAALKNERPALDKKLAGLIAELEARKIKPDAKPAPVLVQPSGSGIHRDTKLIFIECNAVGISILEQGGKKTPVSAATIDTEPALNSVLMAAKGDPNSLVLFLIRADGHSTYVKAAGWAENQFQLRTGKLPIPTNGEIDLSLFLR